MDRDSRAAEEGADSEELIQEKAALEAKLADIESSFAAAEATIANLKELVEREGNAFGDERQTRIDQALENRDFEQADPLLAEIEADAQLAIDRAARAAFGRGQIAEEQVRWADAAGHYEKAAKLDPSYENLIAAGAFLLRAGQNDRAIRNHEDLVDLSKWDHGDDDPKTATAINNLAESYRAMGRYQEAEPLFAQAMEITKATVGEAHPNYATRLNNMAMLYVEMERFDEARPLFAQAIRIDLDRLGAAHPQSMKHAHNYADLLINHFPDDPALEELRAVFGPDVGIKRPE
ncbi:MAG: tetratricopeptide repeat protein [Pseudomonadota bacterium]